MGPLLFICVLRSAMKETGQNLNNTDKIICSDVFKHARLFYSPVFVVFSLSICAHFFLIFVWLAERCDQHNWKRRLSGQMAGTDPGNGQQI